MREPETGGPAAPAVAAGRLPKARALGGRTAFPSWAVALALLPPGWIFIARAHRWHLTPSVVVLCLCWTAVVGAGYALTRLALAVLDHVGDDWFVVRGSREELEREKRSLLRAIKEIEFDRDTGKVSPTDAQALISVYRQRAIDVIKTLEIGGGLTPRERILAELKARAEIDGKAAKAAQKLAAKAKKKGAGAAGAKADKGATKLAAKDNGAAKGASTAAAAGAAGAAAVIAIEAVAPDMETEESDNDADADADTSSDPGTDTGSGTDSGTGSDPGTDPETDSGSDTGSDADAGTGSDSNTDSDDDDDDDDAAAPAVASAPAAVASPASATTDSPAQSQSKEQAS